MKRGTGRFIRNLGLAVAGKTGVIMTIPMAGLLVSPDLVVGVLLI